MQRLLHSKVSLRGIFPVISMGWANPFLSQEVMPEAAHGCPAMGNIDHLNTKTWTCCFPLPEAPNHAHCAPIT